MACSKAQAHSWFTSMTPWAEDRTEKRQHVDGHRHEKYSMNRINVYKNWKHWIGKRKGRAIGTGRRRRGPRRRWRPRESRRGRIREPRRDFARCPIASRATRRPCYWWPRRSHCRRCGRVWWRRSSRTSSAGTCRTRGGSLLFHNRKPGTRDGSAIDFLVNESLIVEGMAR